MSGLYNNLINKLCEPSPPFLLTATLRQTRHIRRHYHDALVAKATTGHAPAIVPAVITSFNEWLLELWQGLQHELDHALPLILSSAQAKLIWQQVVNDSTYSENLLSGTELAKTAYQAWCLLAQWQLSVADLPEPLPIETSALINLIHTFEARLAELSAIDAVQLPQHLLPYMARLDLPNKVLIYGFDDLPPVMATFLEGLRDSAVSVEECTDPLSGHVGVQAYADHEAEWQAAAHTAKTFLATNPDGQIGVVIPDLASNRHAIERLFRATLAPEQLFDEAADDLPYTISSGVPLAEVPVCAQALLTIRGSCGQLEQEAWSGWLRSPYLAGAQDEAAAREHCDAWLRENNVGPIDLARLGALVSKSPQADDMPKLQQIFEQIQQNQEESRDWQANVSGWLRHFGQVLLAAGWPGALEIDSHDFQAISQWHQVLSEAASLDLIIKTTNRNRVLELLVALLHEKLFQMEAQDQPVQILGQLEAGGLQFDQLLVTGLTDEVWPAKPQPNPLLPLSLQHQHQLPHASSERELAFAKALTKRYQESATEVIFSYPAQVDGMERTISPLLLGFCMADCPSSRGEIPSSRGLTAGSTSICMDPAVKPRDDESHKPPHFIYLTDNQGLPLSTKKIRSGASVFSNMSACHFKAYARGRLQAYSFPRPWHGLSQRQRGTIMHSVYQLFWEQLRSQQALLALSAEEKYARCEQAAKQALAQFNRQLLQPLPKTALLLEQQRLVSSLLDWLNTEALRTPFKVIGCEQAFKAHIAGHDLTLRLDRLDRLEDGGYVIIDYKINRHSVADWQGERPTDLQLPLYSLLLGDEVSALAFATLTPRDKQFRGVALAEKLLPGVKTIEKTRGFSAELSWQQVHQQWQALSEQIITRYVRGEAACNPKHLQVTCRLCDLSGLCRYQNEGPQTNDLN